MQLAKGTLDLERPANLAKPVEPERPASLGAAARVRKVELGPAVLQAREKRLERRKAAVRAEKRKKRAQLPRAAAKPTVAAATRGEVAAGHFPWQGRPFSSLLRGWCA